MAQHEVLVNYGHGLPTHVCFRSRFGFGFFLEAVRLVAFCSPTIGDNIVPPYKMWGFLVSWCTVHPRLLEHDFSNLDDGIAVGTKTKTWNGVERQ